MKKFRVVLRQKASLDIELNERQLLAVAIIQEHGELTALALERRTEASRRTVNRDLAELVRLGILKKSGKTGRGVRYLPGAGLKA